ncbi:MAG: acyl-CoA thioesterase [Anaerolineales bacterium]|nr:acyl-CoA thioesterase [Anaerolineales bacterium]MCB0016434.1 acyl-CoA thioesterase [Anaerolineales bacterium]MCB8958979.1 acyl-CoA thioesterase [Ardenticatenales bacterium]
MSAEYPLLTEIAFPIRSYDTDFMGVVNNVVYVRWLSDLRHELLASTVSLAELMADGLGPALTRTEVNYLRPIRLADRPVGRMWVTQLRRTSWRVAAEFRCGDQLMASAQQAGCFIDLASLRPARVPAAMATAYDAQRPE